MWIAILLRKDPYTYVALVDLMAGWPADKMWVELEIFKIPYRLNYSDFYYV